MKPWINLFWRGTSIVMMLFSTWSLIHHEVDWACLFMLWSLWLKTNLEDR